MKKTGYWYMFQHSSLELDDRYFNNNNNNNNNNKYERYIRTKRFFFLYIKIINYNLFREISLLLLLLLLLLLFA